LIRRINLVYQAFDKALMHSCKTWRLAHEIVKAVRCGHIRAPLEELGPEVTVIDMPNEVRWHHRIGVFEKLGKTVPFLIKLLDDPPPRLQRTSAEFAGKLAPVGIHDSDGLRDCLATLGPIVESCVNTFRKPNKQLEHAGMCNCAQHVHNMWSQLLKGLERVHSTKGVEVSPAAKAAMDKHAAHI
jgi:hypothetical protein